MTDETQQAITRVGTIDINECTLGAKPGLQRVEGLPLPASKLLRIANSLGASVDYLLKGETKEPAQEHVPVVIPPALSRAAHELRLTYAETLELLNAHNSVVARRSLRSQKEFTSDDWIRFHKALKKVFG